MSAWSEYLNDLKIQHRTEPKIDMLPLIVALTFVFDSGIGLCRAGHSIHTSMEFRCFPSSAAMGRAVATRRGRQEVGPL